MDKSAVNKISSDFDDAKFVGFQKNEIEECRNRLNLKCFDNDNEMEDNDSDDKPAEIGSIGKHHTEEYEKIYWNGTKTNQSLPVTNLNSIICRTSAAFHVKCFRTLNYDDDESKCLQSCDADDNEVDDDTGNESNKSSSSSQSSSSSPSLMRQALSPPKPKNANLLGCEVFLSLAYAERRTHLLFYGNLVDNYAKNF
ncbi:hypothetical protein HELRODRAFT_172684 [Helobdella robusta]|uniref:Uncharacterized protein n=1 Tax=Helobdella robusta TaxID=6412 RepID=T1F5S2_HELRO|nr:hypothetical protein HELRODRAFT_172684 [Helobdella robusta]ESO04322.1 hypothetical protein HELRODRAFT_172684 [Helobdella robusta]